MTFDDWLDAFPDPERLEPEELRAVCRNAAFQAMCAYCRQREREFDRFDRDELGVPPEEDYDDELED